MEQTEFKEYIYDNLALVLPKLKENDDLVKNKKNACERTGFLLSLFQ